MGMGFEPTSECHHAAGMRSRLVDPDESRNVQRKFSRGVPDSRASLPQLYRFCFLMLGDAEKALEVFEATLHEAAQRAKSGEAPADRFWLFREARGRCLEVSERGLQAEDIDLAEDELSATAPEQICRLDATRLGVWISGAPEPQRAALALFYLGEFSHADILKLAELKTSELAPLLSSARRQFQAWLNASVPVHKTP
jgi:DNA-directed RNA polymerase specialized sigma24 family protein